MTKFTKKANKSAKFEYAITKHQRAKELTQKTLKKKVKTRFFSTHTMMISFLNNTNGSTEEKIEQLLQRKFKFYQLSQVDSKVR